VLHRHSLRANNGDPYGRLVPNAREQAAIARIKELRAVETPLREISVTIAAEFKRVMTPITLKRILDRSVPLSA
jgi:hypothetical protein